MADGPEGSGLLVRRASVAEAESVAWVLRQAFDEYRPLYTPRAFALTTPTAAQIARRWHEGPVWAALEGERWLGTVAAVPRGDSLYLRSMAVVPGARGRGVGRRLVEAVESHARGAGHRRIYLSTTPFLHGAIRLYRRCGFEPTEEGPHDLAGTPLVTMEKNLGA